MADEYVRRDVWALEREQQWHPVVLAYALAVERLRERPADDPTGWTYQAAVHGTTVRPDRWRNQCQHFSWFFLPWHRLYLYWFERIVRSVVASLDEVDPETRDGWALPYWDYGGSRADAALPPAFRARQLPDGRPNPLRVEQRDARMNRGGLLPAQVTSARLALQTLEFAAPRTPGQPAGFGGPVTGWHHAAESGVAVPGALEATPHGVVHTGVGGRGGWMSGFDSAPLDPVFWLHHANIDRLWEVWRGQPRRRDPRHRRWLEFEFDFHDEQGDAVKGTARQVVDTTSLGYRYDDVALPPGPLEAASMGTSSPRPDHPPELVGATDNPVDLTGERTTVQVGVSAPEGPLDALRGGVPDRVYLNVEDVRAEENPGLSYAVYVRVPDDNDDPTDDRFHVGNVHFFGVELTSGSDRDAEHGLAFAFDVTELYRRLRDSDRWNDQVAVTFEPLRPELPPESDESDEEGESGEADAPPAGVRFGRVSIYYQ